MRQIGPASSVGAGRLAIQLRSTPGAELSGTVGAVLDPIFAFRAKMNIAARAIR